MGKIIDFSAYCAENKQSVSRKSKQHATVPLSCDELLQQAIGDAITPEMALKCEERYRETENFIDDQITNEMSSEELLETYTDMLIGSVISIEDFWKRGNKSHIQNSKLSIPDVIVDMFFCLVTRIETLCTGEDMDFLKIEYDESDRNMCICRDTTDYNDIEAFENWLNDTKKYSLYFKSALEEKNGKLMRQSYENLKILALETGLIF